MEEKRQINRLTTYYSHLKKDRPYPDMLQFKKETVSDIWPLCLQIKILSPESTSANFVYEYVGEEVRGLYGEDVTGKVLQMNAKQGFAGKLQKHLRAQITAPHVVEDSGQFVNDDSHIIKYRSCILPFGGEGKPVSHILVGVSWRQF